MKKYLLGLFAITLAVCTVAFTKPQGNLALDYFAFTGDITDNSQVTNPALWDVVSPSEISDCQSSTFRACIIRAEKSGSHPVQIYVDGSDNLKPVTGTNVSQVFNQPLP